MKIGLVYTATTPELLETVDRELYRAVGADATLLRYEDPSILQEVRERGSVSAGAAARLMGMYTRAMTEDADVIVNCCSSVGEVADSAKSFGLYAGVPIVRIDEEMCREAVRRGARIGVMATLSSTLTPTRNTVLRVAREMNRRVELMDALLTDAFGLSQDAFRARMVEKALEIAEKVDCLLLAQGSMAYAERDVADACGIVTLSSPRFGAQEARRALARKGLL